MKPSDRVHLVFGPFRFDPKSGLLFEGDTEVTLPPRAAAVLTCLAESPGEMVSKEELLEAGWGETAVSDQSLTEAVKLLRHALHDDPKDPVYIHTLRGRGYRFIAPVAVAPKEDSAARGGSLPENGVATGHGPPRTPASVRGPVEADPTGDGRPRLRRLHLSVALPVLAVLVIGGALIVRTFLAEQVDSAHRELAEQVDEQQAAITETEDQVAQLKERFNTAMGSGSYNSEVWKGDAEFSGASTSPDGEYIAYVGAEQRPQLWLYETATGGRTQLTRDLPGRGVHRDGHTVFSPDGRRIAYVVWSAPEVFELRVLTLPDGDDVRGELPQAVVHRGKFVVAHDWTPDGRAVLAARDSEEDVQIVSIPVDAQGTSGPPEARLLKTIEGVNQVIADGPQRISLSPDGSAIAYDVPQPDGSGRRDILTLSLRDRSEARIVEEPSNDHSPLWSRDGTRLVYVSDREGLYSLWTVGIDDDEVTRAELVTPGQGWTVRPLGLLPDGSLYYGTGYPASGTDLYVAGLEPGAFKYSGSAVTVYPAAPGTNISAFWMPGGKTLAHVSQRGPLFDQAAIIVVSSVDGLQGRRLRDLSPPLQFIRQAAWSPDGEWILARAFDHAGRWGIYRIHVESNDAERVVRGQKVNFPHWLADGDAVTYLRWSTETVKDPDDGDDRQLVAYRIVRRNLAGSSDDERELYRAPTGTRVESIRLSPDRQQIGFLVQERGTQQSAWSFQTMPVSGGEPVEVWSGSAPDWWISDWTWTHDGRGILFVKTRSYSLKEQRELWWFDFGSRHAEATGLSMPGIQAIALDPTGTRIAFSASTQAPSSNIYLLRGFLDNPPASDGR